MKVLFIGVGLSHYYNQVLNKLTDQPGIELFNLVASGGGHAGEAVFQTKEGVKFNVIELKEAVFNKYGNNRFKGFLGFSQLLEKIKPDIVVVTEVYASMFMLDSTAAETARRLGIKIILKDIPFRLNKYGDEKEKILSGKYDSGHFLFLSRLLFKVSGKLGLPGIPILGRCASAANKFLNKAYGRKVLLGRLEIRKQIFNFVDAHADYVEEAFDIFGSYGVPREKIFIIYNSPDTDILFEIRKKIENEPPILPPSGRRLIHVGRLIDWKRVDMLIESFSKIKSEFPEAELLILGYGPLENYLKDLAKKLKLEGSVKFIGGVYDPAILGKYLISSSVYVLAGMGGISINDAMAFGKPVIVSVCDGTEKKLVREGYNGLYFKDGNMDDLTDKIRYMFRNPDIIKKMGENSTKIIRDEINIRTVVSGYLKAFNYVAGYSK
jgi:glycosyltransferase involved in cell wall biosynthesis